MNIKHPDIDVKRYSSLLAEVKLRMEVISEHLNGLRATKYVMTEVEFLCLQFRKVLELIAFSSVVANKEDYINAYPKYAKHYNAVKMLDDLLKVNPKCYPQPIKEVSEEVINGHEVSNLGNLVFGFLTEDEFRDVYNKCGGILHAENPYRTKIDVKGIRKQFGSWHKKIVTLLNNHTIIVSGGQYMIIGIMQAKEDGKIHANLLKLVDTVENIRRKGF